eukprot:2255067-Amphidinium_carterae.1
MTEGWDTLGLAFGMPWNVACAVLVHRHGAMRTLISARTYKDGTGGSPIAPNNTAEVTSWQGQAFPSPLQSASKNIDDREHDTYAHIYVVVAT